MSYENKELLISVLQGSMPCMESWLRQEQMKMLLILYVVDEIRKNLSYNILARKISNVLQR